MGDTARPIPVASDRGCQQNIKLMYPKPNQRDSQFHFIFYFLTKGLHIINSLTKTKVLVTEFEKHFPSINGKTSFINTFLKNKTIEANPHVPKAPSFPVSSVPALLGPRPQP